ncbi:MAG: hypothetical protein ABI616_05895 [Pseudomonadota bacterium]
MAPATVSRAIPLLAAGWLLPLVLLGGCGPTIVKPQYQMPHALIVPVNARVGLIVDDELRAYHHDETRSGTDWKVELGAVTAKMWEDILKTSFTEVRVFNSLDEAIAGSANLQILAQPRIEQFSFATDRETAGGYWAATIRYRLGVFSPTGQPVDSLTLTGYGNSYDEGGAKSSLNHAAYAAMRDTSAKFLVQLPRQPIAARLASGQIIDVPAAPVLTADVIEAVPINPPQGIRPAP